jgi:hypothetical protein
VILCGRLGKFILELASLSQEIFETELLHEMECFVHAVLRILFLNILFFFILMGRRRALGTFLAVSACWFDRLWGG